MIHQSLSHIICGLSAAVVAAAIRVRHPILAMRAVLAVPGAIAALASVMAVNAILPMVGAVTAFATVMAMHAVLASGSGGRTRKTKRGQGGRRKTKLQ